MIRAALAAIFCASASLGWAEAISLALPIDCVPGESCYIQQYVDHDPGPGAQDFTCAALSYDGHKGTDFGLPTLEDMARGVAVRATAPGVVRGLRDGVEDRIHDGRDLDGKDCGNGVVIRHNGGWETQYCHLKRGSVAVTRGQPVDTGAPLGEVGLSGRTQFPHLHLSVRRDGAVVDPFAPEGPDACGSEQSLWADALSYSPGGLLDLGLSARVPAYDAVKSGAANDAALSADAPALVGYGYGFGARKGDVMEIVIDGPDGRVIRHRALLKKTQALYFRAAGRKRPDGGWPAGAYLLRVELRRKGDIVDSREARITLR